MFSGIIQTVGKVTGITPCELPPESVSDIAAGKQAHGQRFCITFPKGASKSSPLPDLALGASVAVNGVCLTVVEFDATSFSADVSQATLNCTNLQDIAEGQHVNLETALCAGDPLNGHLVTGHVDAVGRVKALHIVGESLELKIDVPADLMRYITAKGSLCIDGVSLTVNEVEGTYVIMNIVPHTASATIIGRYRVGQMVNIEVDMIARYLAKLLPGSSHGEKEESVERAE